MVVSLGYNEGPERRMSLRDCPDPDVVLADASQTTLSLVVVEDTFSTICMVR